MLKYITQIEEEIRTLTSYKFDQYNDNGSVFDNVRGQMGIKDLSVLDSLIALPKSEIEYHKFDIL